MPIDALIAAVARMSADAEALGPTREGVEARRHAASIARVWAERAPGGEGLARARALLTEASLRRSLAGACDASVELAQLEHEVGHDDHAAYLAAYRATRRFTSEADAACASRAEALLGEIASPRPPRAELAVIDADPDADDPSVGLDPARPPPSVADEATTSLEAWAARAQGEGGGEGAGDTHARLDQLTVVRPPTQGTTPPSSVRVVLQFDHVAVFERRDVAAEGALPRRLVLELAGASVGDGVAEATQVDAAGLVRVRVSDDATSARVTLDLAEDAEPRVFLLPDPYRILIDVSREDPTAPPITSHERRPVHLVLLDPGHGGDDYGARAFRLRESDLTLDLALRTRDALLRRRPDIRVVLTRESDTFVSLEQRTAMANAIGADLFVSIHLNAAWEPVDHGGVTTFVLDTTNDRQALRLAARENGTTTGEVTELERILAGLERGQQHEASTALAERIHHGTLTAGRRILPHLHDRGVRSAMFYVLVGAMMPAVLVETSFLTREDEADALRTEAYRNALAGGIADGIARYAAPPE